MCGIFYREATTADIPSLAKIRAANRETEQYWYDRIFGYLGSTHHPQHALKPRIVYVAVAGKTVVALVAGHLTTRLGCDGELEWIDVIAEYRRQGIGSELVRLLGSWFITMESYKICIDPGNESVREFYRMLGATDLNKHWMAWNDIRTIL